MKRIEDDESGNEDAGVDEGDEREAIANELFEGSDHVSREQFLSFSLFSSYTLMLKKSKFSPVCVLLNLAGYACNITSHITHNPLIMFFPSLN